jgi:hypothetical protein
MATLYLKDTISPVDEMAYYVKPGSFYECELTPVIYDPVTLKPVAPSYVIKCDDGKFRKMDAKHFMTLEEFREQQINKILK